MEGAVEASPREFRRTAHNAEPARAKTWQRCE